MIRSVEHKSALMLFSNIVIIMKAMAAVYFWLMLCFVWRNDSPELLNEFAHAQAIKHQASFFQVG